MEVLSVIALILALFLGVYHAIKLDTVVTIEKKIEHGVWLIVWALIIFN